jgi:hypothetical protein
MTRRSTRQNMRDLSAVASLAAGSLVGIGGIELAHGDFVTGIELTGWALISLALLLGFLCPTTCRVTTSRGKPCRHEAYGFMFGCNRGYGHWSEKFLVRLGFRHEIRSQARRSSKVSESYDVSRLPAPEAHPIKVSVEDSAISICGFWIGLVSAAAGLVQVIAIFVH